MSLRERMETLAFVVGMTIMVPKIVSMWPELPWAKIGIVIVIIQLMIALYPGKDKQ